MARTALAFLGEPAVPEMMCLALVAERLGYESVWFTETRFTRDAITTAAATAAVTERVKIGTAVVNPFTRGAVLTAVTFATLDELAGGRVILGIGPGSPLILERQGIAWTQPLTRLREYVDVVRRLLRGESVVSVGQTISLRDVQLDFQPTRSSIPIYLGVTGPRALELAGEIADGVLLNGFVSMSYTERAVGTVRARADQAGRCPEQVDIAASLVVSIDHDGARARDAVRPLIATYLAGFPNIAREAGLVDDELSAIRIALSRDGPAAAGKRIADAVVNELTCAGTPGRVSVLDQGEAGRGSPVASARDCLWGRGDGFERIG